MTQQEIGIPARKAEPLELATLMQIFSACANLVTLALNLPVIIEKLANMDRIKESKKWKSRLERVHDFHDDYKRLIRELLLVFNEGESQFGEKDLKAVNIFSPINRDKFYRLRDLKHDLAALTAEMSETIDELDKFAIENDVHDLTSEKENALLLQFDKILSLWGTGTFNHLALQLKTLNRFIEKRIGHESAGH